jgi:hypothetical protein
MGCSYAKRLPVRKYGSGVPHRRPGSSLGDWSGGGKDPMARDDERDGVGAECLPHLASGVRHTHSRGHGAIGNGVAGPDGPHELLDAAAGWRVGADGRVTIGPIEDAD